MQFPLTSLHNAFKHSGAANQIRKTKHH